MRSLFDVRINWYALIGTGIIILLVVPGIPLLCFIALMIAAFQALLVFYSFGYLIPVRYLAGALMCLQMLVGPSFAYMGLDEYQYFKYKMQVSQWEYFSYAIPAVVCFIIGLNVNSRLRGEALNTKAIQLYVKQNPSLLYIFIIGGFLASVVSAYFGSSVGFVFYLLGGFKFIGAFMLIIGGVRLRPLPVIIVFGSIIVSSINSTMFHDLITWLIFLLAILAIKYRPPVIIKAAIGFVFVMMIVVLQQIKGIYREATAYGSQDRNLDKFGEIYEEQKSKGGFFDKASLAKNNVRINQGFIVTYILNYIPAREPYANGKELYIILEAAFLPRIIAPNKLQAGDNSLVTKYSGIRLRPDTSMSLSALGDAYINFGPFGGCIFMFLLGGAFNFVLIKFGKIGLQYPIALLFTPLVFYFPIRPDTALQTGLGHLVKASFLLYMIFVFWRHQFRAKPALA